MKTWFHNAKTEIWLFLGYVLIVFRPGNSPPKHPQKAPRQRTAPTDWSDDDREVYIAEARRDMDQQQSDKRDVRARAQWVFTTTLVLGGAIAASYSSRHHGHHGSAGMTLYLLAAVLTALGGLAAAGVITAQSAIGAPSLNNLIRSHAGEVGRCLVDEYAATRHTGAATVAVLVTILRDAVLVLVLAFALFVCAHVWG